MSRRRVAGPLALAVGLGLALRVGVAWTSGVEASSDAAEYDALAHRITQGVGFTDERGRPTAFRGPAYPVLLALGYWTCGPTTRVGFLLNAVLGAATVAALFAAGQVMGGMRVGLLAAFLAAVYPSFVFLPRVLLSENLALALLAAALAAGALALTRGTRRLFAVTGVLVGFAVLTRSACLLAAALMLGLLFCLPSAAWRARLRHGLVSVVVFGLVLAPWAVRNIVALRGPVFLSTADGMTLYSSYWPPEVNGKRIWGSVSTPPDADWGRFARDNDELTVSARYKEAFWEGIRREPSRILRFAPEKIVYLLAPFNWEWFPHKQGTSRSIDLGYLVLLPAALLGVRESWRRREPLLAWLLTLPASSLASAVVFYGSPRYRLPAELSLIVLAALGLDRARGRRFWSSLWAEPGDSNRKPDPLVLRGIPLVASATRGSLSLVSGDCEFR